MLLAALITAPLIALCFWIPRRMQRKAKLKMLEEITKNMGKGDTLYIGTGEGSNII